MYSCGSRAAHLYEVIITASDNDVWAVLAKANSIHIIIVCLNPESCLHHQRYHELGMEQKQAPYGIPYNVDRILIVVVAR